MSITKQSYPDLKEYWDFQRKIEYNKEKLREMTKEMVGRVYNQFGMMDEKELFDSLWTKLPQEAYETPAPLWIPENETYRFEWEGEPNKQKQLPLHKKGRPVVLRAKGSKLNDLFPDGDIRHPYDND